MAAVVLIAMSLACTEQSDGGSDGGASGYYSGSQIEWEPEDVSSLDVVHLDLVRPPMVPEHDRTAPDEPRLVKVRMSISEEEIEVEPGVFVWAMTFEGSVPGPMIVVHEGDYVELTLVNPRGQPALAQHRLPRIRRCFGRRRTHAGLAWSGCRVAIPSRKTRRIHLPLRTRWLDGAVARRYTA